MGRWHVGTEMIQVNKRTTVHMSGFMNACGTSAFVGRQPTRAHRTSSVTIIGAGVNIPTSD